MAAASQRTRRTIEVAGPIVVVLVAWASTGARDTMAIANVTLVMAAITVGVALVGWRGGLATSVAAALALNYFHTEPVHSLRITEQADLVAVVLLASLGIAVSTATAVRVRAIAREHLRSTAAAARTELAGSLGDGRPVTEVWSDAVRSSCADLGLVECRLEPTTSSRSEPALPTIARHHVGVDEPMSTFVLPEGGATISFIDPRSPTHVVLVPRSGMGPLELDRRTVTAFVDQLQLALAAPTAPSGGLH